MTPEGWEAVIGLEVHCELKTATKLWCACANAFGAEPNTLVCPVCLGLPGSLPVLNEHAVELAMRIGAALHCTVQPSIFHRKNYFYPDMPKDYQISQYDRPINVEGWLDAAVGRRVGVVRAHMEEDTGKTTHVGASGRIHSAEAALVDYNRAGVPLVEIVSAPDLRSAAEARAYVSELRGILVATGASDGRMEEGSLRVDANVSVRRSGTDELGTRCEIKNLNSLRSLGRAIDFEIERQVGVVESGGAVVQETRHWHEDDGRTVPLRSKEEADDYRYFPEPDLVPLVPDEEWVMSVASSLGEMPADRRAKVSALVPGAHAEAVATVVELGLDGLLAEAVGDFRADPQITLNRLANEAASDPAGARTLRAEELAQLVDLERRGRLSATQSKTVLAEMLRSGGAPADIARTKGFEAMDAGTLGSAVEEAIAAHPAEWERYCAGDARIAQFFVGQVMRATKGKADGKAVVAALEERRGNLAD